MIKFYVNVNQLHNFLELKEPVQFVPYIMSDSYVEMLYNVKDIDIKIYRTYITVELKKRRGLWQRIKSIHKKN